MICPSMQLWNLPVLDPLESTKATRLAGMSLCQARNKKGLQSTDRLTQDLIPLPPSLPPDLPDLVPHPDSSFDSASTNGGDYIDMDGYHKIR